MKIISIIDSGTELGKICPRGIVKFNIFRTVVGMTWTQYYQEHNILCFRDYIKFHNDNSHIQIEELQIEAISMDG